MKYAPSNTSFEQWQAGQGQTFARCLSWAAGQTQLDNQPAARRIGDVLGALAGFSPDFMAGGRGQQTQADREPL